MYFSTLIVALCLSFVRPSVQADLPTFQQVLNTNGNLTSFNSSLVKFYPELTTFIGKQTSDSPITVLAPSNAAFDKTVYYPIIGPAFSNNDRETIRALFDIHVVLGNHPSSSLLPTFQYFPTHLTNASYANVTGGQRVGAVMQSGKEMFWTSGQSNRSPVIQQDIAFEGGTIHIVDSMLIFPTSFPATAELFATAYEPQQLTSFLGATYFTPPNSTTPPALARYLNVTSDLTLFVPNNAAMSIVAQSLQGLSADPAALDNLLSYHMVAGNGGPWFSTSFTNDSTKDQTLTTVNGGTITIRFSSNAYFVNGARVLNTDLMIAGGVMHVIDNVLAPDQAAATPQPSLGTQVPALATGGVFNISSAPFTTFLPNTVNTVVPTQSPVSSRTRTTTTANAQSTGTGAGKGAGSVVRPLSLTGKGGGGDWWLMGSMAVAGMVGMGVLYI